MSSDAMRRPLSTRIKFRIKKAFWAAVPLQIRKWMAIDVDRAILLPRRHYLCMELVRDWAESDVEAYHRFLWSNHLGYARVAEATHNFDPQRISPTRRLLFGHLTEQLEKLNIDPRRHVRSVFEVGCAQGYLLRFLETNLFPAAVEIAGMDIDAAAIELGKKYLTAQGSKIQLICADVSEMERVLDGKVYDVILCPGVLLYLSQDAAAQAIDTMIHHARQIVAIADLGHPEADNAKLQHSEQRKWDAGQMHNIDAMVTRAGGKIIFRQWLGNKDINGQRIHFVFSTGRAQEAPVPPTGSGSLRKPSGIAPGESPRMEAAFSRMRSDDKT
jgi:2-polyprenyl-3-methyl-5-hydroxy-6-metoxy-1,4-benzoquinol methylase